MALPVLKLTFPDFSFIISLIRKNSFSNEKNELPSEMKTPYV